MIFSFLGTVGTKFIFLRRFFDYCPFPLLRVEIIFLCISSNLVESSPRMRPQGTILQRIIIEKVKSQNHSTKYFLKDLLDPVAPEGKDHIHSTNTNAHGCRLLGTALDLGYMRSKMAPALPGDLSSYRRRQ